MAWLAGVVGFLTSIVTLSFTPSATLTSSSLRKRADDVKAHYAEMYWLAWNGRPWGSVLVVDERPRTTTYTILLRSATTGKAPWQARGTGICRLDELADGVRYQGMSRACSVCVYSYHMPF